MRKLLSVSPDAIDSTERERRRAHKPTPPRHASAAVIARVAAGPAAAAVDAAFLNVPVAYKYPASKAGEADQTAPHLEATRPGFPFLHRLVHALDDGERLSRCVLGCSIASARKLDSLFVCSVLSDHRQILWLCWPGWLFLGDEFRYFDRIGVTFGDIFFENFGQ